MGGAVGARVAVIYQGTSANRLNGLAPAKDNEREALGHYRASSARVSPRAEARPGRPEGGLAAPSRGNRAQRSRQASAHTCPFGECGGQHPNGVLKNGEGEYQFAML